MGSFFPPLLFGIVRRKTGSFAISFILLAVFAIVCLVTLIGMNRPRGTVAVAVP